MNETVFAVLWFDSVHAIDAMPEISISVMRVVHSREEAEAEVKRLEALSGAKGVRYWYQRTRLFPPDHAVLGKQ